MLKGLTITVILLLFFPLAQPGIQGQTGQMQVLILYETQQGKQFLEQLTGSINNTKTIKANLDDEVTIKETDIDLIFVEGDIKDMSDSLEALLEAYVVKQEYKGLVAFSWNIKELSGDVRRFLGVENTLGDEGEEILNWQINVSNTLTQDEFQQFTIQGKGGLVEPTEDAIVLGEFTDVNSSEIKAKYKFPLPATIYRNTSNSIVLSSFFELGSEDNGALTLTQLPQSLIEAFISIFVSAFTPLFTYVTGSNPISEETVATNNTGSVGEIPAIVSPDLYLIILIIATFFVLLFKPIIGFFRWISEKSWAMAIAIVSSVYHIQNRQLTEAQISMNPIRATIMDYLEFVGTSGAHLREIKSVVGVGMGNLLWHLQVLEEYGWIEKRKIGRYNVYIASEFIGNFDADLKALELELRSKHAQPLIEFLLSTKPIDMNISKIAQETGIGRKAVRTILRTLQKFEVIKKEKTSEGIVLKINEAVLEELLRRIVEKARYDAAQIEINVLE